MTEENYDITLKELNEDEYDIIEADNRSLLSKIDDWLFDNVWGYPFLYRLWHNHLAPHNIKRMIKFFFQRIFRGFDDSETWSLDWTFYRWLQPRLKRFMELNCAYPGNEQYPTFESWQNEISKRLVQLEYIIKDDDYNFDDWSYIPKKELKELNKKHNKNTINLIAFCYMKDDFNKWFAENLNWLWW